MIRIVADTTAGLDPAWAKRHGIPIIPQVIYFGETSYLELQELSLSEYLAKLRASPTLPRTAAPPPGLFVEAFQSLEADKNTILCIHPSTEVSGTVRSAQTAKEDSFPNADIRIIDTRAIAGPLAQMIMMAAEWVEAGEDADTVVARLQALIPRVRVHFMVDTLEYLQRGGRIGGATALVGKLLQFKPILTLRNGRVEPLMRERTKTRAMQTFRELVRDEMAADISPCLQIMHSDAPAEAQSLFDFFQRELGRDDFLRFDLVPAIVTHAGPGTLAVGFFAKQ